MVDSVGKKLNQARLKRGLTIDEAAHATRLRPDKITALENDDYSRFANNIYAKGFLQIYARYLNVDVSDFARTLDNPNPISVGDYQYLTNAPAPRRESAPVARETRRPPSVAPLLFFLAILAIGGAAIWLFANAERMNKRHGSEAAPQVEEAAPTAATPAPSTQPVPSAVRSQQIATAPGSVPSTPVTGARLSIGTPSPGASPAPVAATASPKNSDQDFITPTPVTAADSAAHSAPGGVNEVQVATVKTTWVTVRKDDPKAAPIFEDYVYPRAAPLKLKGARFFIEARDPTAVQITKNGLPVAYQAPNVPVQ